MSVSHIPSAATRPKGGIDRHIYLAVALVVLTWASAFAGIRVALHTYQPLDLALLRYLFASAALLVYVLLARMPLPRPRDLPAMMGLGLPGIAVYNVALIYGEIRVPAATASFLIASAPVWMAVFAGLIFKERPGPWGWAGIATSFLGVAVIGLGNSGTLHFGPSALLVLGAAFATSLYSLGQKPYLRRYSALQCTTYAIWGGTFCLLPFGSGLFQAVSTAPWDATLAVAYLGLIPGAIGYVMWSYALGRVPAAQAGSFLYLIPAFALVIAWIWLGEVPTVVSMAGGALVLAGVILVNRHGRARP